jgi:hypothetical protein
MGWEGEGPLGAGTLTRLAALGTLSRGAGEGLWMVSAPQSIRARRGP